MSKYELKQSIILELEIDTLREQVKNLKKENAELKWKLNQFIRGRNELDGKEVSKVISPSTKTDME